MASNQPFAKRLKQARLRKAAGRRYSQEQLGIEAGIVEETASARMNQYERGVHLPDLDMAARIAKLLDVPLAYLFCSEDDLAELLLVAHTLSAEQRRQLLVAATELSQGEARWQP